MVSLLRLLLVILLAGLLAACGGGSRDQAELRVLHAVPDAPIVDVSADGRPPFVSGAAFKTGSGFRRFDAGTVNVTVSAGTPGGSVPIIGPIAVDLAADTRTTLIAAGTVATIEPLILGSPIRTVPAGRVGVQVIHAAPAAPTVDVYVTGPDEDLAAGPLGSFAFRGSLGPVELAAGAYRIRVTPAGDADTVVFDSGAVMLPGGGDLLVAAVANTGPGESPIGLVVLDGSSSLEIPDAATPAALRVVHAIADAPAVDVIANDAFEAPLVSGLAFPQFTSYVSVPAAEYNMKLTPAGNPGVIVLDQELVVTAGTTYSVLAIGALATPELLALVDDGRSIATEARMRIIHGSPSAGDVDIYLTEPGAGIGTAAPAFAKMPFKADTGYVSLVGGGYEVTVTPAGSKTAVIGPVAITLEEGGVYTAIARDGEGGSFPPGLILLDDFVTDTE